MAQRRLDASALVDQLVAVQIETTSVEAALNAARKDMDETQTKALDDAQSEFVSTTDFVHFNFVFSAESEHFYQLTCLRMNELRDLHQRQPAAEHELFMVSVRLASRTANNCTNVQMQNKLNADIATELMHVEQDAVRLAAAQASLSEENRQVEEFVSETIRYLITHLSVLHRPSCFANKQPI